MLFHGCFWLNLVQLRQSAIDGSRLGSCDDTVAGELISRLVGGASWGIRNGAGTRKPHPSPEGFSWEDVAFFSLWVHPRFLGYVQWISWLYPTKLAPFLHSQVENTQSALRTMADAQRHCPSTRFAQISISPDKPVHWWPPAVFRGEVCVVGSWKLLFFHYPLVAIRCSFLQESVWRHT